MELKRKLLHRKCAIYDSAEDRGEYYLCRKYETYIDAEGEFYRNAYYGDDAKVDNIVTYQFYMKDNIQISPAFRHYSESKDEDILLVIDEKDHKRKYIDRSSGTPMMIPGEYDHAWRFSEGKAAVCVNGKLGFIDKHGKYIIEPLFAYSSNPKYGLDQYNRQLEQFVDFTFNEGLCPMRGLNGKHGLIEESGNWVLEPKYECIEYLIETHNWLLINIQKTEKEIIISYSIADSNGKVIVIPKKEMFILNSEDIVMRNRIETTSFTDLRLTNIYLLNEEHLDNDSVSKIIVKYDNMWNRIEETYFDEDGKLCRNNDGYAKVTLKYDEKGYINEVVYFDEKGMPCKNKDVGYAKKIIKCGKWGNIIEEAYFDENGKPCRNATGIARWTCKFDGSQVIEYVSFDEKGQIVEE